MENWTVQRGRVAGLKRHRPDDDPDVVTAVRDLKAARLEAHIKQLVDVAPPLTDAQRVRLTVLLHAGAAVAEPRPETAA